MNADSLIALATRYRMLLSEEGARPIHNVSARTERKKLNHMSWMCDHILESSRAGKIDQALRYLRFLQGALYAANLVTGEHVEATVRPEER